MDDTIPNDPILYMFHKHNKTTNDILNTVNGSHFANFTKFIPRFFVPNNKNITID